jgi:ferrous iron transport protein A
MSAKNKKLSKLQIGEKCIIDSFTHDDTKQKLLEMGFLPGEQIKVDNHAPLGDPIAVSLPDYTLSMRLDEADTVIVTPID